MKLWQKSVLGLGLVLGLVVLTAVQADEQDKKKGNKGDKGNKGRQGQGFQVGQQKDLVSTELAEKLKLTAEQKTKITKLNTEFAEKIKPINEKLKAAREKGGGFEGLREQFQDLQKVRTEFTDKVKTLLTDDQKKTFDEGSRGGRGFGPGGFGPGGRGGFGRPAETSLFSRDVQDKLGLSGEQKDKLAKLKKELDDKSAALLTAEQKKKLEEIKKDAPQGRPQGRRPQQ